MKTSVGMEAKSVAAAYLMALEGVSSAVLNLAVKNLMTGKAPERFSQTFLPTAPELASYCDEIEKHLTLLADRTEQLLSLPEASPQAPEMTEAEAEERRQQIQTLVMSRFTGEGN